MLERYVFSLQLKLYPGKVYYMIQFIHLFVSGNMAHRVNTQRDNQTDRQTHTQTLLPAGKEQIIT